MFWKHQSCFFLRCSIRLSVYDHIWECVFGYDHRWECNQWRQYDYLWHQQTTHYELIDSILHMIMRGLTAYCPSNGDCIISCHDTSACVNLNVYCPSDANCIIWCHDSNACDGGDFFAHPNARLLSIQCGAHSACDSLYIRCPDRHPNVDYNCILNVSTSDTFYNVDIYSTNNKVFLQGSSSSTTLHCGYEWYDECDLGTVNGEWQCEDTSSVCNQFVTITSSNWTLSPSGSPTTASGSFSNVDIYSINNKVLLQGSSSSTTAIPTSVHTSTIACNSENACKSQTMYCTEGEHCYIECTGSDACNYATFHCPVGAFNCDVLCSGSTNLAVQYGCRYMTIYGNATNGGNMTIYGINKHMIMRGLTAYCPS
eukprot:596366_1